MRASFDVLRDDFAQDQLLGEVLGADHDVVARAAAGEQRRRLGNRESSFDPTESSVREKREQGRGNGACQDLRGVRPMRCRGR